ncbi:MAG: PepSY-associated TM helix domain-containing protein [Methylotenera sp.]|nr:PepSY-associated TM helix domain-containing protein [Methylotenera sp.]MDO9389449.1 PepSY-associated TM helix domain-containing protein [Methylotenera sp.]MDP2102956.1 PepSY-associated TM helix domain-containing protein [Methylotenera sp.]MDP2282207.1 PepSY-associated TM helix domain-containing protein [Methylotenera sp.]MDP3059842.1 PepSY-associated TM helix domain-containing protein [Methylotenera sp.]
MRTFFTIAHRWLGLITAIFLFITGLTGAVISWDHELDDWLNDHLMVVAPTSNDALPIFQLVQQVEMRYPQLKVVSVPLNMGAGKSVMLGVAPILNPATQQSYDLGFNEIFLNPYTGHELGKRDRGAVWPLSKENFVSFLYRLHFSLHIPEFAGIDRWGIWLLGVIAIVWLVDTFIGFYLTLPNKRAPIAFRQHHVKYHEKSFKQRWAQAWKIRLPSTTYKLNFDIHRAFGLWTWLLLFIVAFTAFSLNLRREVFLPLLSQITTTTPTPFDLRKPLPKHAVDLSHIEFERVLALAKQQAVKKQWKEPAGSIFLSPRFQLYAVSFFTPESDHGVAGAGNKRLYYDQKTLAYLGERLPWSGTVGDIFVQAQFPLHSGRILGLPGRVLISLMGLVVAVLSVTGVYIWYRKRYARVVGKRRLGRLNA